MQNYYKLKESRFYKGDLTASEILLDVDTIIAEANLNERQSFVLEQYWKQGSTQEDVAKQLGVSQQMVEKHCKRIKAKIEIVLMGWGELIEK